MFTVKTTAEDLTCSVRDFQDARIVFNTYAEQVQGIFAPKTGVDGHVSDEEIKRSVQVHIGSGDETRVIYVSRIVKKAFQIQRILQVRKRGGIHNTAGFHDDVSVVDMLFDAMRNSTEFDFGEIPDAASRILSDTSEVSGALAGIIHVDFDDPRFEGLTGRTKGALQTAGLKHLGELLILGTCLERIPDIGEKSYDTIVEILTDTFSIPFPISEDQSHAMERIFGYTKEMFFEWQRDKHSII